MLLVIRNPRFRLLWSSSVINFVGLICYFTVHGWLALAVTDSEFWVGATYGMNGLSLVLFSAGAGVLVDRLNRKTLILIALVCQGAPPQR
ncbi:MAG: MFS transporter [Chloroflexi bacterium]|nr:MFS transporter [Chloroflexota bacterium]